ISRFDDDSWVNGMWKWWGGINYDFAYDATTDASNSPTSGSVKITVEFLGPQADPNNAGNQFAIGGSLAGGWAYNGSLSVSPADYSHIVMDVLWDHTNSTMPASMFFGTAGDKDGLGLGLCTPGWQQYWFADDVQPVLRATGSWERVMLPIDATWGDFVGIVWKKWFPMEPQYVGTAIFWIDNIVLKQREVVAPPPKLAIRPAQAKGLQLFASAKSDRWQRQMIRTRGTSFSWVGGTFPVTYRWSIASFPPAVSNWFNMFNTGIGSWTSWWGQGVPSWSTLDRWTNSASGSLKVTAQYKGQTGEQFMLFQTFGDRWPWDFSKVLNGNSYASLQFDILVDPSSAPGANNDYGTLEVGFIKEPSRETILVGNYTIPVTATSGWVHVNLAITPNAGYDAIGGLYLKQWCNGYLTNTLTFWIDNLVLYGANGQMHVFFVPEGASYNNLPYGWGDSAVDWNCKSMLFLRIQPEFPHNPTNLADFYPGYICRIGYKTNQPSGQSMIFGPGLLCVLSNSTVLGEWSLTFSNATDFTLRAPGGATASGSLPADVAQNVFNDNLAVYFGHQPNSRANIFAGATNQTLTLNRIQIEGLGTAIDDSFEAPPLNSENWTIVAAIPQAVWIVPRTARWILEWTVPDSGFKLQTTTNVVDPESWMDLMDETAAAIIPTTFKMTYITNTVPSPTVGYFRLLKPGS
ncbi:MAG: hypothetical protein N2379_07090, partial [Verrucomicrobiae bacterium]|nr:hypothetical protein [Verrucomicrobiae bacterium]